MLIVFTRVVVGALSDLLQQFGTDATNLSKLCHRLVRIVLLDDFLIVFGMLDFDVLIEASLGAVALRAVL